MKIRLADMPLKAIRILLLLFLFLNCRTGFAQEIVLKNTRIMDYAMRVLPHQGVLKDNGKGYIYLKVDDRYITKLFPMLEIPGFVEPPFIHRKTDTGAHISVFYVNETKNLPKIAEIGKTYSFTPKHLSIVNPSRYTEYAVIVVDAPELEDLRLKYNLTPKLQNHDFHITIGKKRVPRHL